MSGAACKQAMCAAWPEPERQLNKRELEKAIRKILISSAFTDVADVTDPDWVATIVALGITPMTDVGLEKAQFYIHKQASM